MKVPAGDTLRRCAVHLKQAPGSLVMLIDVIAGGKTTGGLKTVSIFEHRRV